MSFDRRTFIKAGALGGVALSLPVGACKSAEAPVSDVAEGGSDPARPPAQRPEGWDPVAYNLARGAAGFIPASYMADINAEGGIANHLGKHLPFIPALDAAKQVPGMVPLMWGDPAKGHAKHPNAPRSEANPEGHWYNWIRVAIDGQPEREVETRYDDWPATTDAVNGRLVALKGDDVTAEAGKNTVYLAQLPAGAQPGQVLRIWAHCLTHGEYVDFVELA